MAPFFLEQALVQAERSVLALVLRAHPEWNLGHLLSLTEEGGCYAKQLAQLTVSEISSPPELSPAFHVDARTKPIDVAVRERAKRAKHEEFDAILLEILAEAEGTVQAGYLRARAGGPRWKLRKGLARLEQAGHVERTGTTSATRYRCTREDS